VKFTAEVAAEVADEVAAEVSWEEEKGGCKVLVF